MTTILSEIDDILKDRYGEDVPIPGLEDPVAWSTCRKTTNFKGRKKDFAIQLGMTPGVSHTFSHAQANAEAEAFECWNVTRGKDYAVIKVDREAYEAAEGDGAQVDYVVRQVETARATAKWRMNRAFYRNHGVALARLDASAGGGGTDTLLVQERYRYDLRILSAGMQLVSSNTDGTSGSVDANPGTVAAINTSTGEIVNASGNWNASFANSDYLFLEGDFGQGFYGWESWNPLTAPGATSFFGVDRTRQIQKLSGHRPVATSEDVTLENFLLRAITENAIFGGRKKLRLYWNTLHNTQLIRELGSFTRYDKTTTSAMSSSGPVAGIGYKSITIVLDNRELEIVADPDAPLHQGYLGDPDGFVFEGLGEAVRVLRYKDDSFMWSRLGDADAMESRIGTIGQFVMHNPGSFSNLNLEALTNPS